MSSINNAKNLYIKKSPELTSDFFDFCDFCDFAISEITKNIFLTSRKWYINIICTCFNVFFFFFCLGNTNIPKFAPESCRCAISCRNPKDVSNFPRKRSRALLNV